MMRNPLLDTSNLTKRFSLGTQKRCQCKFGRKRRFVWRFEWETLDPVIGRFPVIWHTLDIPLLLLNIFCAKGTLFNKICTIKQALRQHNIINILLVVWLVIKYS